MRARRSATSCRVVLDPSTRGQEPALAHLKVQPTRAGVGQAITQIAENEAASAEKWNFLKTLEPGVTTINRIEAIKPGATTLLAGIDESRRERPVLAFQRYGRGKSFAFTLQDSWQWQMAAPITVEDMTHEHFWRQLLRWLVDGVPDGVEVQSTTDRVEPSESATLRADIVDSTLRGVERCRRDGACHRPRRQHHRRADAVEWRDGAANTPPPCPTGAQGWYEAKIDATRAGKTIGIGDHPSARRARRRRVLRRHDARRNAAPRRGRNRRPLLHAGDDSGPRRRS